MKCKLEDIADVTMGQSPKSEFYNSDGEGMPFLQGNRTFGTMYPTFDTYTTKVTKMAKAGDVIMSVRAPVGDLNFTPVDMCLGRGVCGIRMKNGNQKFLFYLLKYYMPLLINKESGTVFGSVNRNDINGLEVDIPEDESDQKIIARYLAMLDDMIEENEKINKNLTNNEPCESVRCDASGSSLTHGGIPTDSYGDKRYEHVAKRSANIFGAAWRVMNMRLRGQCRKHPARRTLSVEAENLLALPA